MEKYGDRIARSIYRPEISRGSIGGNSHVAGEETESALQNRRFKYIQLFRNVPVIFIHGLGTRAGDFVSVQRVRFSFKKFYEILNFFGWLNVPISCNFSLLLTYFQ